MILEYLHAGPCLAVLLLNVKAACVIIMTFLVAVLWERMLVTYYFLYYARELLPVL